MRPLYGNEITFDSHQDSMFEAHGFLWVKTYEESSSHLSIWKPGESQFESQSFMSEDSI